MPCFDLSRRDSWCPASGEAKAGPFEFNSAIILVPLHCHLPERFEENPVSWQESQKIIRSRFIINVIIFKLEVNTIMKCLLFLDLGAPFYPLGNKDVLLIFSEWPKLMNMKHKLT